MEEGSNEEGGEERRRGDILDAAADDARGEDAGVAEVGDDEDGDTPNVGVNEEERSIPSEHAEEGDDEAGGSRVGSHLRRAEGAERMQIQRIRELELEQLEVEEVDSDAEDVRSDDSSNDGRGDGGAGARGGFTFDTSLASLHTYLGDVDDIASSRSFLDGGALLTLPMFYLEGIVLFPEDTLPLRVLQPRFKAAVEQAMRQSEAQCTLGVIHVRARSHGRGMHMASVGTTAEIRQWRRLPDGSMNVVARGRQRFRVRKAWTEADGAPCALVQMIEEDTPMHIPRGAFGNLACVPRLQSGRIPRACPDTEDASDEESVQPAGGEGGYFDDADSDSAPDEQRFVLTIRRSDVNDRVTRGEESSEEEGRLRWWWRFRRSDGRVRGGGAGRTERLAENDVESTAETSNQGETSATGDAPAEETRPAKRTRLDRGWGGACKAWAADESKWMYRAQLSTWPHWVYRMYDAFDLARRAADMLRQMAELPRMDEMVRSPAALSFYIASKMPLQDSTRQELLEVDGVVHRLRREIKLLESMDRLRCKTCLAVIARRSNMLVMSADGPISAYVNDHGYVHETLTLSQAWGLILRGRPDTANSWFPGYAWTIAYCSTCELHMGWRFTAVKKDMQPKAFWGVRRSQLADNST